MMGKLKVWFVIILMVLSLVPVYTVTAESSGTDSSVVTNSTLNQSANATRVAAEVMLRNLERLQNYTASLINGTENISAETMELYERALNLTDEARTLYAEGRYRESLHTAILAMKAYRDVIRSIRLGTEPELIRERTMARIEAMRMHEYFEHVRMLIRAAEMHGLNVSNVTALLNQTRAAYLKVLQDLRTNDTALGPDLERARELRKQLDMELERLQMQFAIKKADRIARAFDWRLEMMIRALERMRNVPGFNTTAIDNLTQELNQLRIRVDQLVREGKYVEALHLIKESTPKLIRSAVHLRWIHKDHRIYWPVERDHRRGSFHSHHEKGERGH